MRDNNQLHQNSGRPHGTESEQDGSLSDLLNRCGHYYAHRIGGSRRGQTSVLAFLSEHPDVTQKELVEELGITPASLSEVLMKLERKGCIDRVKDETDRRFTRVRLTGEGRATLNALTDSKDDPFSVLTGAEQETLKGLLSKLLTDWETRCTADRDHRGHRGFEGDREFSRHGNEHPGHGDEHPGHGREERGNRSEGGHGREAGRRGHGHH